jgi:hypothetical protein
VYLAEDPADAALLLDKAIAGCAEAEVPEIVSLGNTLARWRAEILAHHDTGASNGPTEGLEPVREEGEALRARVPHLRALPAAGAAPCRRRQLAKPSSPAAHPNPCSLLKRVGPLCRSPCSQHYRTASRSPSLAGCAYCSRRAGFKH